MLYNNLPDYTRRQNSAAARKQGLPSMSFANRTASAPARHDRTNRHERQMRRPLQQPAWQAQPSPLRSLPPRSYTQSRPSGQPKKSFTLPAFTLPRLALPKLAIRPRAVVAFAVLAVLGLSVISGTFPPAAITQAFAGMTTSEAEKTAAATKLRTGVFTEKVSQLIAAHPGEDIAVSAIDLSDGTALTLGDQGTFTAASTAKLLTATTLLRQVESGKLSLSKYVAGVQTRELLERMVVQSDNTAWKALNDYLTHDALQKTADSLGWTGYNPKINSLRPADMARLTARLYKGELLNPQHTKLLLDLMLDANKQEYIVTNVPIGDYTVYHKAGWLDGLMHDVAIITNGQKTIVLAIYTFSGDSAVDGDTVENQEMFAEITKAALEAYFPAPAAP